MKRLLLACSLAALLSGCAATQFGGVSLAPGAAEPEVQRLAARARDGDKRALFELGLRYEEGRGVPRDLERAERLYAEAAASRPDYAHIREVPVSQHGVSGVRRVQTGVIPGLAEARLRLQALRRGRGQP